MARERDILATLEHPNIDRLCDARVLPLRARVTLLLDFGIAKLSQGLRPRGPCRHETAAGTGRRLAAPESLARRGA
jgi:hypothetical protein